MENTDRNTNMTAPNPQIPPLDIADIPTAAPIEPRRYTLFEGIAALISLPLAFMFTHYACRYSGGIWGGVFWLVFGILLAVFAAVKKLPVRAPHIALFSIAVLFCFVPLFSANIAINYLAAVFSFLLYFYLGIALSGAEVLGKHFVRDIFAAVFAKPFSMFGECPRALASLVKKARGGKTALYIFLGLLLAVPLSIVVLLLLMLSDGLFESFMDGLRDSLPSFDALCVFEIAFAVPIAFYLCGMLFSAAKKAEPKPEAAPAYRIFPLAASCAAVTPVCLFYLVYLIIQLNYLGAAFGGEFPEGVSYSEFARRGFFELCVIAFINLCVILLIQTFSARKEGDRRPAVLKAYTVLISVFTLLLIASAMCKMFMYIGEYGMTRLRIYTSWFMALLAVMFVVIIVSQFIDFRVWRAVFAAFTVMFGMLCFSNVDGMIARYNADAYRSGALSEVDFGLLEDLGVSSARQVLELSEEFPEEAGHYFEKLDYRLDHRPLPHYFSIQRAEALNAMETYREAADEE